MATFSNVPYGASFTFTVPIIKRAAADYAVSADWTPATGDVTVKKDNGSPANIGTLPTAVVHGNTALWSFTLTATEMQASRVYVVVSDASVKAVEDQNIIIETIGAGQGATDVRTWVDELLKRDISAVEGAAAANSLVTLVLLALHAEYISSTLLRIYRTDNVTTHQDKTITSAPSANAITKIT